MTEDAGRPVAHVESRVDGRPGLGAVHIKTALDEVGRDRLRREADVLSSLQHPNIVEVITTSPDELVTRLAGRRTLADRGATTFEEAALLAEALRQVIDDLHGAGWTHGAIDPAHVIVGPDRHLTLCSWRRAAPRPAGHSAYQDDLDGLRSVIRTLADGASPSNAKAGRTTKASRTAARRIDRMLDSLRSPASPSRPDSPGIHPSPPGAIRFGLPAMVMRPLLASLVCAALGWMLVTQFGDSASRYPTALAVSVGVLRWMAVAAAGYLGIISATLAVGRAVDASRVVAGALQALPAPLRRTLTGMIGVGVLSVTLPRPAVTPSDPDVAVTVAPPTNETVATTNTTAAPASPTTTSPTTTSPTTTTATTTSPTTGTENSPTTSPGDTTRASLADVDGASPASPRPPIAQPTMSVHVIERGEHLWAIASSTVQARLGRVPTEREIARYWRVLVAANRASLPDPDHPDLVFVGQIIVLPD